MGVDYTVSTTYGFVVNMEEIPKEIMPMVKAFAERGPSWYEPKDEHEHSSSPSDDEHEPSPSSSDDEHEHSPGSPSPSDEHSSSPSDDELSEPSPAKAAYRAEIKLTPEELECDKFLKVCVFAICFASILYLYQAISHAALCPSCNLPLKADMIETCGL